MTPRLLFAPSLPLLLVLAAAADIRPPAAFAAEAPSAAASAQAIATAPAASFVAAGPVAAEPRLVHVSLDRDLTLEQLLRAGFDVIDVQGTDGASLLEWPLDRARVLALGNRVQVLDEHPGRTAALLARTELAGRARLRAVPSPGVQGDAAPLTAPPIGSGSMGGYWTTAEIKLKLDDLVAGDTHDVVAGKIDTVGYSREGRPIWGLELGKHVTGTDTRPVVFYNALTHAREPGGMETLLYFVDDILSRYGTDPFATYLLDKRRLYIVPLVNPDGYHVNEATYTNTSSFGLWRKNTRDNDGNGSFDSDSDGVDLNRNFGFQWGYDNIGSSPDVTQELYRGPSAFSEPETRVQRDLIAALKPKTGLSFHTYQDIVVHPWGYTLSPALDAAAFHEWDDLLSRNNAYQTGVAGEVLYLVNGEFNDWCYGDTTLKPRAFTWTPEVGSAADNFWPPPSRILPLAAENLDMSYRVAAIAGAYVRTDGATVLEGALNASYLAHLSIRARNVGAGASAGPGLTGALTPLDPGVQVFVGTVSYPALAPRTCGDPLSGASFQMLVDDTVTVGRLVRFRIDFTDANGLFSRDTVSIPLGTPTVLAADDASAGLGTWTVNPAGTWGIVTSDPAHPSAYFADSPSGNYGIGANWQLTLNPSLDLSPGVHAYAVYDARWEYERDYDAGLVEASLDGTTWTPLNATGSSPGSGLGAQLAGKPYYAGTRWLWKTDWADLSPFTGPAGLHARFRVRTRSDGSANYDGMNVDSIRIMLFDPAQQPALVAVDARPQAELALAGPWPNPARGKVRMEFSLPAPTTLRLDVLDLQGRVVRTLASGEAAAGRYARVWDIADSGGRRSAPGIYFLRLALPGRSISRRFVVVG